MKFKMQRPWEESRCGHGDDIIEEVKSTIGHGRVSRSGCQLQIEKEAIVGWPRNLIPYKGEAVLRNCGI